MSKQYEVKLLVNSVDLGNALACGKLLDLKEFGIPHKIIRKRMANGKTVPDVILERLGTRVQGWTFKQLVHALDRPKGTVSSGLNKLLKDKKVRREGDRWQKI